MLLASTHELDLLVSSLEATMAELGGGVNELKVDLLQCSTAGLLQERLSDSDTPLLWSHDTALHHEEILVDGAVVRESSQRSDTLLSQIEISGSVGLVTSLAHSVDLLVHLGTVVVSVLTSTSHGVLDLGRMPSTDTSNLTQTAVSLPGKTGCAPTSGDTLVTLTLGHADHVNHLILSKNGFQRNRLFEELVGEVNLVSCFSTVDLDFAHVRLLLGQLHLANLGVGNHTNHGAVLLDASKLSINFLVTISILLHVLGESLLLALVPVLVKSPFARIVQVLSPDSGQGTETTRSLNVANNTDNAHGRCFQNGNSLHHLFLVQFAARLVNVTEDVSHASLVAHEGSKVATLARIVSRKGLHLSPLTPAPLAREKTQRTVTRSLKLPV
jgi:hypothetical protein